MAGGDAALHTLTPLVLTMTSRNTLLPPHFTDEKLRHRVMCLEHNKAGPGDGKGGKRLGCSVGWKWAS